MGKVLKVITIETQTNNHNKEALILKACLPFCEQAMEERDKELTLA